MNCPHVGDVQLVDWCTRQPTRRALKTRSCSGLHTWIVHALEVFDSWTDALVDRLVELKRSCYRLRPGKFHAWEVRNWWTGAFVDQLVEP